MDRLLSFIKNNKKEIEVSIAATIVFEIIKSLLQYLNNGGKIMTGIIVDFIYYEAGRITVEGILCMFIGAFVGIICGLTIIVLLENIINKKIKKTVLNEPIKTKRKISVLLIINTLFLITLFLYPIYCLDINGQFERNMKIIKPYITQNEYDMLYSKWVTMMSKRDYISINKKINKIKCQYIIKNKNKNQQMCNNTKD